MALIFLPFQVSLLAGPKQPNKMVTTLLEAAAAVPGLTSMKLCVSGSSPLHVHDSLLVPLTAAAGGPKKLEMLHLAASFSRIAGSDAIKGWFVLQQLNCLRELSIRQLGGTQLNFPVDSLPASLEVFRPKQLLLIGTPCFGVAICG